MLDRRGATFVLEYVGNEACPEEPVSVVKLKSNQFPQTAGWLENQYDPQVTEVRIDDPNTPQREREKLVSIDYPESEACYDQIDVWLGEVDIQDGDRPEFNGDRMKGHGFFHDNKNLDPRTCEPITPAPTSTATAEPTASPSPEPTSTPEPSDAPAFESDASECPKLSLDDFPGGARIKRAGGLTFEVESANGDAIVYPTSEWTLDKDLAEVNDGNYLAIVRNLKDLNRDNLVDETSDGPTADVTIKSKNKLKIDEISLADIEVGQGNKVTFKGDGQVLKVVEGVITGDGEKVDIPLALTGVDEIVWNSRNSSAFKFESECEVEETSTPSATATSPATETPSPVPTPAPTPTIGVPVSVPPTGGPSGLEQDKIDPLSAAVGTAMLSAAGLWHFGPKRVVKAILGK
jgi:hypothetical protein